MRGALGRFGALLIGVASLVSLPAAAQSYDTHVSITAKSAGSPSAVIPAGTPAAPAQLDFVATSPVLPPSAAPVSQTLEAHWDSARLPLKSLASIAYPQGWSLQYEVGGVWSPALPSDLLRVTGLQATGAIRSLGNGPAGGQAGQQVVIGSNVIATPAIPATISIASNGDGWDVFFDPANTMIFNIFHHTFSGRMDCHMRSNGSTCPGWGSVGEIVPGGGSTSNRSTGVVIADGRILVPKGNDSQGGFGCLTTAGTACSPSFFALTASGSYDNNSVMDVAYVSGKVYTLDQTAATLLCFNPDTNAACDGENNWALPASGNSRMVHDSRYIYGYVGSTSVRIFCYDTVAGAACAGWGDGQGASFTPQAFLPVSRDGVLIDSVCAYTLAPSYTSSCVTANGQAGNPTAALTGVMQQAALSNWFAYGNVSAAGSRTYWSAGLASPIYCYDASTDSQCWSSVGFPTEGSTYTVVPDPNIPNCIWTNSDGNGIKSWNAAGSTPVQGCGGIPATIKFSADANGVRMACPADNPISGWQQFQVANVFGASSARLTVLNSSGAPIAGWKDLPAVNGGLGAALVDNAAAWDLAALSLAQTGQHPTFTVALPGMDHNVPVTANLQAVGGTPELCWSTRATPGCPVAIAPGLAAASGTVAVIPAPPPTFISASSNYGGQGSTGGTSLTPASVEMAQVAPVAAACYANVAGYARFNATAVGLSGMTVSLGTADGTALTYNGVAVTTTTGADGAYQFNNVLPNSGFTAPTTAQQYAVSFGLNANHPFLGTSTVQPTATGPIGYTGGYTVASNVLPLVSAPPAGTLAPPPGQVAVGQSAKVTAFYSPTTALLSISATASSARLSPGGSAIIAGSYSVQVGNISSVASSGAVAFVVQLPSGMTATPDGTANAAVALAAGSLAGWSCSAATADGLGQTLLCSNAPAPGSTSYTVLAGGASAAVNFNVYISGTDLSRTLVSSSHLVAATMGGDLRIPSCGGLLAPVAPALNATGSLDALCAANRVGLLPNLGLTNALLSVNGAAATVSTLLKPGDVVRYSQTATNNTAGVLANANLTQTVPTGTVYTGIGEGWVCAAGTSGGNACTWTQATLGAGVTAGASFSVTVVATNLQTVVDNLTSSTPLAACVGTGSAVCSASNLTVPQISVSKIQSDATGNASNAAVGAAGTTYFKVSLRNSGGAASFGSLGFTDTLPLGLGYYSTVLAGAGMQCSYNTNTRVIACSSTSPLAAGATTSVVYQVGVAANASGTLTNGVILTGMGGDPRTPSGSGLVGGASGNSSNGTAAQTALVIQPLSSLVVSQVLSQVVRSGVAVANPTTAVLQAGDVLTYTITAQAVTSGYNAVLLSDLLPADTHYSGAGVASDGTWTCGAGSCTQSIAVAANSTVNTTLTLTVDALAMGVNAISNVLTPSNPAGSANISVPACTACASSNPTPPYLSLTKVGPAGLMVGQSTRYTVTLSNSGGTAAAGLVTFTDLLPAGVWFDAAAQSSNGFVCAASPATATSPLTAQTMTCTDTAALLNPGASINVAYAVTAQATAVAGSAAIVNQASLRNGAMGGDPRTPAPCTLADPGSAGASGSQADGACAKAAATLTNGSPSVVVVIASIQRGGVLYTDANLPAGIGSLAALPVNAGDVLTYTVTGSNATVSASQAVTVQQNVPLYTTFSGGVIAGGGTPAWSCTAGAPANTSCAWDVGSIPAQSAVSAQFVVTVGSLPLTPGIAIGSAAQVGNTGAAGGGGGLGLQPVCLRCVVVLSTAPRLQLSAQFSGVGVAPLNSVALAVTLRNLGGASTTGNLAFGVTLPLGLALAGSNVSINGFQCAGNGALPQVVACNSINGLAAAGSTTVTMPLQAASGITGSNLNAQIVATAIANDPRAGALPAPTLAAATVGANALASVTSDASGLYVNAAINALYGALTTRLSLYQVQRAGVQVAVDASVNGLYSQIVQPGDVLTYRLRLSEAAGTSTTTVLTQTVPANTRYSDNAAAPEGWSGPCAAAGSVCTQTITVNGGGVRDVYFTSTADSSFVSGVTLLTDVAQSSANPACGTACSASNATPPLLAISVLANQAAIASSTDGSFAVGVRNTGGSMTTGALAITLNLPDGLVYAGVSGAGAACTVGVPSLGCRLSEIVLPGATVTAQVRTTGSGTGGVNAIVLAALDTHAMGGDVRAGFATSGANLAADPVAPGNVNTLATATVAASGLSAKALVAITPAPSLSLVQSAFASGASGLVAEVPNSFTLTVTNAANAGNATGASIAVAVPAGWRTESYSGTAWTCANASGAPWLLPALGPMTLQCTYGLAVAAGSSAPQLAINGTPTAATVGTIVVVSSSVDPVGATHPPVPGGTCAVPTLCASTSGTVGAATGPALAVSFSEPTINVGGLVTLVATLSNPTASTLTAVGLAIPLPVGLNLASVPALTNSCGGAFTVVGAQPVWTGATVPSGQSCVLRVTLTTVTGLVVPATLLATLPANTLVARYANSNASVSNALAVSAGLQVIAGVGVTKSFSSPSAVAGAPLRLTLTLRNGTAFAATDVAVTDILPSAPGAMVVNTPANASTNCAAGALSADAGATLVAIHGVALAAGGSCVIGVDVHAPVGAYINSIPQGGVTGLLDGSALSGSPSAVALLSVGQGATIAGVARRNGSPLAAVGVALLDNKAQPVFDASGHAVRTTSAADGSFAFTQIAPSVLGDPRTTYGVQFFSPPGATAIPNAVPQHPNPQVNGTPNADSIVNITALDGVVTQEQNVNFVDPQGITYNTVTRQPVAGTVVTLVDAAGTPVSDACLDTLQGTPNGTPTPASGNFVLLMRAACLTTTPVLYHLQVTPPLNGFRPAVSAYVPSALIAPGPTYTPTGLNSNAVQAQARPPTGNQPTTYYTSFNLASNLPGLINNHLPLDALAQLSVVHGAVAFAPGLASDYTVRVANGSSGGPTAGVTLMESIPTGITLNHIGTGGWLCTAADGSALALPVHGPVAVRCYNAGTVATGAALPVLAVGITPDLATLGQPAAVFSVVAAGNLSVLQLPPVTDTGTCLAAGAVCASSSGVVALTAASLMLQKTGSSSSVELGDSVQYVLTLKHSAGAPQSQVVVTDTLPRGFKYIANTVRLVRTGATVGSVVGDAAAGVVGVGPVLNFNIGNLQLGDSVTISYRVRVGVGAQQGDGINRAVAHSAAHQQSNEARFTVKVSDGVFTASSCLVGKVFVDCNGSGMQTSATGDPGIPGVRLYMEDGTHIITDSQGKFSICGLVASSHVVKVDPQTLPAGALLTISANRNASDPGSLFIDGRFGELARADFIEGSCSPAVLQAVRERGVAGPATARTPPGASVLQAATLRFGSRKDANLFTPSAAFELDNLGAAK